MRRASTVAASLVLALCVAGPATGEGERKPEPQRDSSSLQRTGRDVGDAARHAGRATADALRRVTHDVGDALRDLADRLRS
jgi:hypothetical protein